MQQKAAAALKAKFGDKISDQVSKILLFDKNATFHAIYGIGDNKGGVTWIDKQGLRKKGPLKDDYFVYFSSK